MAKKRNFFSHSSTACFTQGMLYMMKQYDYGGYGLYWRIIESLFVEEPCVLEFGEKTYEAFSSKKFPPKRVQEFIHDCIEKFELFQADDQYFYSEWVVEEAEKVDKLIEQRINAVNSRWDKEREKNESNTSV